MVVVQTSNIIRTLVVNEIVDHSDVVGASPVVAAPTTSLFSNWQLALMDWVKTTAIRDEKHIASGIWCGLYKRFDCIIKFRFQEDTGKQHFALSSKTQRYLSQRRIHQHDVVRNMTRGVFCLICTYPRFACWQSLYFRPIRGKLDELSTMDDNHCLQCVLLTQYLHQRPNPLYNFCRYCFDRPEREGLCLS